MIHSPRLVVSWGGDAPSRLPRWRLRPLNLATFGTSLLTPSQYKFLATRLYAAHQLSKHSGYVYGYISIIVILEMLTEAAWPASCHKVALLEIMCDATTKRWCACTVHSRRSHGQDLGLLLEPKWTVGHLFRIRGQHHASLANGTTCLRFETDTIQFCLYDADYSLRLFNFLAKICWKPRNHNFIYTTITTPKLWLCGAHQCLLIQTVYWIRNRYETQV